MGQSFAWVGTSGAWADLANWQQGGLPATTAPGSKEKVSLLAGLGIAPEIVVGAGNAASLSVAGDFALDGAFNLGRLSVDGTLAIMAGASVSTGSASIGDHPLPNGQTASLLVSGTGASLTDTGDLQIGNLGVGSIETVAVSNHGTLHAVSLTIINPPQAFPFATIDVDGTGTFEVGIAGERRRAR